MKLNYLIKHPPFYNKQGETESEFVGEYYVNSNVFELYIGDCIWLPVEDKIGIWEIYISHDGQELISQKFNIVFPESL